MTDKELPKSIVNVVKDQDRKRGFLTKRDRDYIFGRVEVEGQAERDLRYRIRNRVENGLLDAFALDDYSDSELEKIIESADYLPDNLVVLLFSLAYRLLSISYESESLGSSGPENLSEFLEDMIEHSIKRVEREREGVTEVNVDIEIAPSEFEEDLLLNRILAGNASMEEFWTYMRLGDVEQLISRIEAESKEDQFAQNIESLKEFIDEE